jgi:hypothetical protein
MIESIDNLTLTKSSMAGAMDVNRSIFNHWKNKTIPMSVNCKMKLIHYLERKDAIIVDFVGKLKESIK